MPWGLYVKAMMLGEIETKPWPSQYKLFLAMSKTIGLSPHLHLKIEAERMTE